MLTRFLKGFKKVLKGEKGYTLVEIAAVVAVTATLVAVALPVAMDKMKQGKEAAALMDCKQIGTAITAFYKDTGQFPAYSDATRNYFDILRSGNDIAHDPVDAFSGNIVWAVATGDYLENHLIVDNPGGALGTDYSLSTSNPNYNYLDSHKLNWKGPYAETFTKRDPWGNNYLVYIKAMHTATTGTDKEYGWIISAGPDATLETDEKDNALQGDDIGYYPFAAESGH